MADALLSIVLEQLASVVKQEVKLVLSVREDVKELSNKLEIVNAMLHDAEMKQFKDKAVKLLMEQLNDILYVADDVLDEWNTRINLNLPQIQGVHNDDGGVRFRKKVLSYFLCPCFSSKSVLVDYGFGTRIREIRDRFEAISKNMEFYKFNPSQSHEEPYQRLTSSIVDVSEICGREHDKKVIISNLLSESSHQDINTNVISIVGTAGFGKTTLAKIVLEDEDVKKTFEKIMWVCVSEPFNLTEIAKKIIKQAVGSVETFIGWEDLHPCLCNSVNGSRFLLVLDDVWTKNSNDWNPLKLSLNGGARGSRIIVTTRSENVAQMMGSSYKHNLEKLSDDNSWLLFKRIAFSGRQEDLAKLENIGMEICKNCKGVPLAIKIVASLVRYKKTKKEWRNVLESEIWDIQQIQEDFLPSLFLSYYPLPSILKQCFMYCAIFQKDQELEKDQLVKLWMAQGFLGFGGNKPLEKIGEEYFDDLAMRSFFQISKRDLEGNISICMMHDLVHDFAQFLAKEECCILESGKKLSDDNKFRHIGNHFPKDEDCSTIYKAKNLRTLWASRPIINLTMVFKELKYLRVLDLSYNDIEQLPDEIERLLHLRYLDLSESYRLLELPKTISRLYNLQTLKLNRCWKLNKLPDEIVVLINLRHLELENTNELSCLPQGFGRLKFLRTLSKFIVGNNGCDIIELKDLCFLQGSLVINGLGQVADANRAAQAELKKKRLDVLSLNFDNSEEGDFDNMSVVFENLQPHEDVQELNIVGFTGLLFPSWIPNNSMSINLVRLRLDKCNRTTELPALGNLALLEELYIIALSSVKHIGTQFCGFGVAVFPKLKKLVISKMLELIEWEFPISTKIMPCLQELELSDCPMLRELPGFGRLESLESLKISKLASITRLGPEFFGISDDDFGLAAFPKLKKLEILNMLVLIEWEFPVSTKIIMPCLQKLTLMGCPMLSAFALPGFGRLESLEILKLSAFALPGPEFFGISGDEFGGSSMDGRLHGGGGGEIIQEQEEERASCSRQPVISFPCLVELNFSMCPKLEGILPDILARFKSLEMLLLHGLIECEEREDISLSTCLRDLCLTNCDFHVIPRFLFPHTLKELTIVDCKNLRGMQPCLPPLLELLTLDGDLGVLSESLPIGEGEELSHNYPNLRSIKLHQPSNINSFISISKYFNHLTAIQCLSFSGESLDFDLNGLKHFTMLNTLGINFCPILAQRFESSGDDWMTILSHVPNIILDGQNIKGSY